MAVANPVPEVTASASARSEPEGRWDLRKDRRPDRMRRANLRAEEASDTRVVDRTAVPAFWFGVAKRSCCFICGGMTHQTSGSGSRRYFTEAARAKALSVRLARAGAPKPVETVFVARHPSNEPLFVWEIRKFGGVVLDRSANVFSDPEDAKIAGDAALRQARQGGSAGRS